VQYCLNSELIHFCSKVQLHL